MDKEKKYVLITGATSGIGLALAEKFAKNNYPLVLVARNTEKLKQLSRKFIQEYKVDVHTISQDLASGQAAYTIFEAVKNKCITLEILINNAGFNEVGNFTVTDLKKEIGLIKVHIASVIELTKLFLPELIQNKFGRIVYLGSTGSFMPVPGNAVYCTSKSFIYTFSRAIRHELRNTGVKVTTLCPGATHTNFHIEAEMSNLRLFNIFPMKPERVAKIAFQKILKGKKTIVPGLYNKFIAISPLITPPWLLNRITDWMYKPVKKYN